MLAANRTSSPSGDDKQFIEDVFSITTYRGNNASQRIYPGIDVSEGMLVWEKQRNASGNHILVDTERGKWKALFTNTTQAQYDAGSGPAYEFFDDGYTGNIWGSTADVVSYAFAQRKRFLKIVTWTGNGVAGRQIPHDLGVAPGMIVIKRIDATSHWFVWHRSAHSMGALLNDTGAFSAGNYPFSSPPTSDTITPLSAFNTSGAQYVAYLFAHDDSDDGIIQCGSFTGNGSAAGQLIDLGWEPQWLLIKNASGTGGWTLFDSMRGLVNGDLSYFLQANTSNAESSMGSAISPSATGFNVFHTTGGFNASGNTYVFAAIRRGPMRKPTSGTQVFAAALGTSGASPNLVSGFPVDLYFMGARTTTDKWYWVDRLRGAASLNSTMTSADGAWGAPGFDSMTGALSNAVGSNYIGYMFRRYPGVFDQVCYTGSGAARSIPHGLQAVPELMIVKNRGASASWAVYHAAMGALGYLNLESTAAQANSVNVWGAVPTDAIFSVANSIWTNAAGNNYTAYLFASLPGITSIKSFVGDGTVGKVIDCGFVSGARFILLKAASATGSWWIFDSTRGIVVAADPALQLNSTAAEITSADAVDIHASGFIVNQEGTCNLNVNGVTYIVLAIA